MRHPDAAASLSRVRPARSCADSLASRGRRSPQASSPRSRVRGRPSKAPGTLNRRPYSRGCPIRLWPVARRTFRVMAALVAAIHAEDASAARATKGKALCCLAFCAQPRGWPDHPRITVRGRQWRSIEGVRRQRPPTAGAITSSTLARGGSNARLGRLAAQP
jgi:hypothetical protein